MTACVWSGRWLAICTFSSFFFPHVPLLRFSSVDYHLTVVFGPSPRFLFCPRSSSSSLLFGCEFRCWKFFRLLPFHFYFFRAPFRSFPFTILSFIIIFFFNFIGSFFYDQLLLCVGGRSFLSTYAPSLDYFGCCLVVSMWVSTCDDCLCTNDDILCLFFFFFAFFLS